MSKALLLAIDKYLEAGASRLRASTVLPPQESEAVAKPPFLFTV